MSSWSQPGKPVTLATVLLLVLLSACRPEPHAPEAIPSATSALPSSVSPASPTPTASVASPSPSPTLERVQVPKLTSLSESRAESTLVAAKLKWRKRTKETDGAPPFRVMSQSLKLGKVVAAGRTVTFTVAIPRAVPLPGTVACPANPLLGVYHSWRLHVLKSCQWFVGTVVATRSEEDGDHHIDIAPDPGYGGFLNTSDRTRQHGGLLIEVMPGQSIPLPSVGAHISVFGTWVYDTDHGWNELHPIWAMRMLETGRTITSLPPVPPRYDPDPVPPAPEPPPVGNCDPAYPGVCLLDGIGDYDCANGEGLGPNFVHGPITVLPPDPFDLDGDNDGIGCESG
jgi:hypothetical protein